MSDDENKFEKSGPLEPSRSTKKMPSQEFEPALTQRIQHANKRHEMRTPLNAIIGYSEMLLEDAESLKQERFILLLQNIRTLGAAILKTLGKINIFSDADGNLVSIDRKNLEVNFTNTIRKPLNEIVENTETLIDDAHELDLIDFIPDLEKIYTSAQNFLDTIQKIAHCSTTVEEIGDNNPEASEKSAMIKNLVSSILPFDEKDVSRVAVDKSRVLIVDDNVMNRDLFSRHLEKQGHRVSTAENGRQALEVIKKQPFDAILLDILMPEMNGYQVLRRLKHHHVWRDIPIIMISALEEMDIVAQCIEVGADDYLIKPISPILLYARLKSCLERKRLHDLEKEQKRILKETFGKYVAHEVRDEVLSGRIPLGGELKDVTVLFADLRNFTPLTESTPPNEVVGILNSYFTEMAPVISNHRGSLLRYVGDEIFAVFGAPLALNHHFRHALEAAIEMRQRLGILNEKIQHQGFNALRHGIGIHSGPVVAANIGSPDRLAYDLVGDTVNLASRIQGLTKEFDTDILISSTTKHSLDKYFAMEALPTTLVKGRKAPVEIFKVI